MLSIYGLRRVEKDDLGLDSPFIVGGFFTNLPAAQEAAKFFTCELFDCYASEILVFDSIQEREQFCLSDRNR